MRILIVAALLVIGVVGCEDGALDLLCETRCEEASRLFIEAECTPALGGDYVIDIACQMENASRCGGNSGPLAVLINPDFFDVCKLNNDYESNPDESGCNSCIFDRCGQTRDECIEDLMGTLYGTLVYECVSER
jgi:hypothetical protein